ncbi:hypothetical protein D3C81_1384320 [compost metagenome]
MDVFSLPKRSKNHFAILGITPNMINRKIAKEIVRVIQNSLPIFPWETPVITARIISTAVSVRIVPPIVIATASILEIP